MFSGASSRPKFTKPKPLLYLKFVARCRNWFAPPHDLHAATETLQKFAHLTFPIDLNFTFFEDFHFLKLDKMWKVGQNTDCNTQTVADRSSVIDEQKGGGDLRKRCE